MKWSMLGFIIGGVAGTLLVKATREEDVPSPGIDHENVSSGGVYSYGPAVQAMNQVKAERYEENLKIIKLELEDRGTLANRDIVKLLDVSPKTARNYCSELIDRGVIHKVGEYGRSVRYTQKV